MNQQKLHFRHSILYEFQIGHNATEAHKNLCFVFGKSIVSVRMVQRWFEKFRSGDINLQDEPRTGRPDEIDDDALRALVDNEPLLTTRELANKLHVSHVTIENHLNKIGFIYKWCRWISHQLSEKHIADRISIASSLLSRQQYEPFLDRLVTGDEKWIVYDNVVRKRAKVMPSISPPTVAKANIHQKKLMCCIWWDCRGPIYWEILQPNQTVTADLYCDQLTRLDAKICELRPALYNRKGVIFQHDNARPHVALRTKQKLGYEVLSHPPYSPDLAPSDYHLFLSMQNFFNGKKFQNFEGVQKGLTDFLASKDTNFYTSGINNLVSRWKKVIESSGQYFFD